MSLLQEIKNAVEELKHDDRHVVILPKKAVFLSDMAWLIEQAEKIQKIEHEIDHSDMSTAVENIIEIIKG